MKEQWIVRFLLIGLVCFLVNDKMLAKDDHHDKLQTNESIDSNEDGEYEEEENYNNKPKYILSTHMGVYSSNPGDFAQRDDVSIDSAENTTYRYNAWVKLAFWSKELSQALRIGTNREEKYYGEYQLTISSFKISNFYKSVFRSNNIKKEKNKKA